MAEVGLAEVGSAEVGSAEIRLYLWMLLSPCIPGDCTLFEYIKVFLICHVGSPMNTRHYRDWSRAWQGIALHCCRRVSEVKVVG